MPRICIAFLIYVSLFFVIIFDIITFPVYVLSQLPCKKLSESRKIKAVEVKVGKTDQVTYKSTETHKSISRMISQQNLNTVNEIFKLASAVYKYRKCLGTRKILGETTLNIESGKKMAKYYFGPYIWKSFNTVSNEMMDLSRGLYGLGLEEKKPIAILAETRAEWLITALACFERNIPLVTVYVTMHEDGIVHAINLTEPTVLFTSHIQIPKLLPIIDRIPTLKVVIYFDCENEKPDLSNFPNSVYFMPYSDLCYRGQQIKTESASPNPDDAAIIMFTSGTTDTPKGVIITHRNLACTIRMYTDLVEPTPQDIMIAYLPLAHIFEFSSELVSIMAGTCIGYSSPLTLTDYSPQIMTGTKGDASELKPSIILATPLVIDRINNSIKRKVSEEGELREAIFNFALSYKKFWHSKGFSTPLTNSMIFKGASDVVGGNARIIVCGGAPLCPSSQLFASLSLCTPVIQGYGLTETTGCGMGQRSSDLSLGRIGGPMSEVFVRLGEVEDEKKSDEYTIGELILGGPFVSPGYFKIPNTTGKGFFGDDYIQWFHTGDMVMMYPDGSFSIVDRIKDKMKLQHGEYICLGKVEAEFKMNKYVCNICIHVDATKYAPVAIVSLSNEEVKNLGDSLGLTRKPIKELLRDPVLSFAIMDELNAHAKLCKMNKYEIPTAITIVDEDWTPESGLVTAQYKIVRREIYKKYEEQLQEMYHENLASNLEKIGAIHKINTI